MKTKKEKWIKEINHNNNNNNLRKPIQEKESTEDNIVGIVII